MSATAFAQTQADTDAAARQAEILRRQQQEQIARDREAASPPKRAPEGADLKQLAPKPDASSAGQGCHNIGQIAIAGAKQMSQAEQARITQPFIGTCMGVAAIEQLLGEVTKYYIDRGFVTTRAYLPGQDLASGTLNILVVEGTVERVSVEDGGKNSIHTGTLFPEQGSLLNLRDLEQGIDQVNQLASNSATLDIRPGSTPGGSEVVIVNQPTSPYHATLTADNEGSKSTGQSQVGVTVSTDNLLNRNEWLMYTHRESWPQDRERKNAYSDSFSAVLPLGYTTVSMAANGSSYVSMLKAPSGAALQTRGTSNSVSATVERVMLRNHDSRWTVGSTFTRKSSKNYLDQQLLEVSSRTLSVLDLDTTYWKAGWAGALEVNLGYSQGLKWGGALQDPSNLPDTAPRAQFGKVRYGAHYSLPFELAGHTLSFTSSLTGQSAQDVLYGSEQMLIGGNYSVRGFVDNTLSGDNGFYVRNDLSWLTHVTVQGEPIPLRLYLGLDYGRVKNKVGGIPEGSLTGMAVGASMRWRWLNVELMATRPLNQPSFMTAEPSYLWLRLSFSF